MTSLECLIPELRDAAQQFIKLLGTAGVQPRVTSTCRSYSEQARLYKRYREGHAAYPAAPPGTSAHEFGYAIDIVVVGSDNQNDAGEVWESWGGVWGGRYHDPIHFEYPGFSVAAATEAAAAAPSDMPVSGGAFYQLIDFLSGFVPWLGNVQLVDEVYRLFAGQDTETLAEWYLQHPAEAIRDIVGALTPTTASYSTDYAPPQARLVSTASPSSRFNPYAEWSGANPLDFPGVTPHFIGGEPMGGERPGVVY